MDQEEEEEEEKSLAASCSNAADRPSGELTKPKYYEKLLSILWAGIDVSVMFEAYKNFDRELLISIHNRARLNLTHPQVGKVFHMHDAPEQVLNEAADEASESLDELVPVKVQDLEIGKWNECCAIYGVLCVMPFKFGRIYTLLEEVDTGKAVALSIVSSDPSSIHQGFAKDKYPQGLKIAVKEPLLVVGEGGIVFIDVNNPWCIESVKNCLAPQIDQRKLDGWINRGNAAWQAKDWEKCRRYNTNALLCVSRREIEMPKDVRLIYSQRWMANIMLDRYAEALQDAEWICHNRPSESSGIQFKIRSLLSVGRYKEAFRFFEISCASFKEKEAAFTQTYRKWSKKYANDNEIVPDGGFVGTVEMRMTNNGSGRGLFATESVDGGETLLLAEPLAVADTALQNPIENGLLQNVKNALVSSGEKTLQIFLSHAEGSCDSWIPNTRDFFEEKSPQSSKKLLEMVAEKDDEIRRVIERTAFNDRSWDDIQEDKKVWEMLNQLVPERVYHGVWLLPSFINHSCTPNAARITDKEFLSIHATKSIEKGEEITIPYFGVLVPLPYREKYCKSFGFDCICKRCEWEERFMDFESKGCAPKIIYEKYSNALSPQVQDRSVQLENLVNQVEKCLSSLRQNEDFDENGEDWIRASFMAAYFARIAGRRKTGTNPPSATEEKILFAAARGMEKTCPGDVYYLTFCQSLYTIYKNLCTQSARLSHTQKARTSLVSRMTLKQKHDSTKELLSEAFISVFAQQLEDYIRPDILSVYRL